MSVLRREIRQTLLELELVSQVPAASLGSSSRDSTESIGGKRPPGGVQWHDEGSDEEVKDFPQRGVEHFKRRIARVQRNAQRRLDEGVELELVERSSTASLRQILKDAKDALRAAKRQPPAKEPPFGSPQWKRHIAESKDGHGTLATRFGCSRAYIQEIRRKYRVEEAA
jgi:hypothetical protein